MREDYEIICKPPMTAGRLAVDADLAKFSGLHVWFAATSCHHSMSLQDAMITGLEIVIKVERRCFKSLVFCNWLL